MIKKFFIIHLLKLLIHHEIISKIEAFWLKNLKRYIIES